jgi:hypothetical protein
LEAALAIGSAWCEDEELVIPGILHQTMAEHCEPKVGMMSIELETEFGDPSARRDITDPIYHPCWWTLGEMSKDVTGTHILGIGFNRSNPIAGDVSTKLDTRLVGLITSQ